jgi:hypothetical protein
MLGDKNAIPPLAPMSPAAIAAAFTGAFNFQEQRPWCGGLPRRGAVGWACAACRQRHAGLELLPLGKMGEMGQVGDGK